MYFQIYFKFNQYIHAIVEPRAVLLIKFQHVSYNSDNIFKKKKEKKKKYLRLFPHFREPVYVGHILRSNKFSAATSFSVIEFFFSLFFFGKIKIFEMKRSSAAFKSEFRRINLDRI